MGSLLATVLSLTLMAGSPKGMHPRVLFNDSSHCNAIMVRDGHIAIEEVCTKRNGGTTSNSGGAEVTWDGQVATVTRADEKASDEWIKSHSLLSRLSVKRGILYWDGKQVDLGKTAVTRVDRAIPWQGGVLISGATVPRKGFFQSWPFKGPFFDVREMEPSCVFFFDINTVKGEDHYLTSFAVLSFMVFPIPD